MTRNQIIIAVLQNAIAHLWDGSRSVSSNRRDTPEYVCHAIEAGIAEVVHNDRMRPVYIEFEPDYGPELSACVMSYIPRYLTADGYCRNHGIHDVQAFRLNMLKSMLATYQAKEAKTVKGSELARATLLKLHRPSVKGHPGVKSFACHAMKEAAAEFRDQGRTGVAEAEIALSDRIARTMGLKREDIGAFSFEARVIRLLGNEFVDAQPAGWMQEQRANMLTRAAEYLEAMGN